MDSIRSKHYTEEHALEAMVEAADCLCDMERTQSLLFRDNVRCEGRL